MNDGFSPGFWQPPETVPSTQPQGTTAPARYAQGTKGATESDLVATLVADRDNWRRIAFQKDRQLIQLLNQVTELREQLQFALGAIAKNDAEAADHDRS